MEKRLIRVGNSYALVIDKPIRSLLGLGCATRLSVITDGVRIIVEPLPKEKLRATSTAGRGLPIKFRRFGALRVYDALVAQGLEDDDRATRLSGNFRGLIFYRDQVKFAPDDETKHIPIMDRLDICIDALNAGSSWNEAIDAALAAVPLETSTATLPIAHD